MITWAFQVIILITFGHLIGLHEFVRNLIKNLSYRASVIWIPPEIQNWSMHPAVLLWVNSFCRAWVQQTSTSNTQLCFVQMKKKAIV